MKGFEDGRVARGLAPFISAQELATCACASRSSWTVRTTSERKLCAHHVSLRFWGDQRWEHAHVSIADIRVLDLTGTSEDVASALDLLSGVGELGWLRLETVGVHDIGHGSSAGTAEALQNSLVKFVSALSLSLALRWLFIAYTGSSDTATLDGLSDALQQSRSLRRISLQFDGDAQVARKLTEVEKGWLSTAYDGAVELARSPAPGCSAETRELLANLEEKAPNAFLALARMAADARSEDDDLLLLERICLTGKGLQLILSKDNDDDDNEDDDDEDSKAVCGDNEMELAIFDSEVSVALWATAWAPGGASLMAEQLGLADGDDEGATDDSIEL
eukprot:gnl/TRDRNA2_/TRDRNA2_83233_c0_seq1.p1 gnl/TRDRNA2_/TRDRNA2_83233_c0~~gnl/TRDRNA2_/TRDRNA2_83233_c0_seq1.p1  ORF type:complete len:334 (-),score=73.61 gnl/TRDRNA2_/TRDRNA2_83233_c0_seq1:60-1061(-)